MRNRERSQSVPPPSGPLTAKNWTDLINSILKMAACAGFSLDDRDRAVQQMEEQTSAVATAITTHKQDIPRLEPGGTHRPATLTLAAVLSVSSACII